MNKRYKVILNFLFHIKLLNVEDIEYKNFCMMIYRNYTSHRQDIDMYYDFDGKAHSSRLDRDVLDLIHLGAISIKKKESKFYLSLHKN